MAAAARSGPQQRPASALAETLARVQGRAPKAEVVAAAAEEEAAVAAVAVVEEGWA